jgi:hypothetical protein
MGGISFAVGKDGGRDGMFKFSFFRFLRNKFTEEQTIDPQTNVVQHHRQPVHKRNKYRCFVCQSNQANIDVIAERIDSHPRLTNPTYGMLLTANIDDISCLAGDADILLLSLDDQCHATDALLDLPELRTKMVVVISDRHELRKKIKNRVDYWMPNEFIETDGDFQSLMAPVIDELDNDYPPRQPTPIKSVYSCFIWQIERGLPQIIHWIEKSERLCVTYSCHYLTYSDQERDAVQEADILILSSGGDRPDSLIYLLDHYDIRSKVVIVSTVFSADRVLNRTPRRIDYVLERNKIFDLKNFNRFLVPIINDLDGGTNNEFQRNDHDVNS